MLTKNQRDRLQVRAFFAMYKMLYDLPPDMRLAEAIARTSDEIFDKMLAQSPDRIEQWISNYSSQRMNAGTNLLKG